ncbi:MAG: T9SS type A sorting domain-containing protein, partial [Bacteroidales bacterium]
MKISKSVLLLSGILIISTQARTQTVLSGNYEGVFTLTAAASPYLVTDSAIFNCSPLHVEPGVIITFKVHAAPMKKSYMRVEGSLNFSSSITTGPVIFTSERDNKPYDLNGDGTASRPTAGDWGYVLFDPSTPEIKNPDLVNVHFRYGGGKNYGEETDPEKYPMVVVSDFNNRDKFYYRIAFSNGTISHSAGVGLLGGMANLKNSQVHHCSYGIRMSTSDLYISNSELRDNRIYPLFLTDPLIKRDDTDDVNSIIEIFYGNDVYNNGHDVIALEGTIRCAYDDNSSATLLLSELFNYQLPYLITDDLIVDSLGFDIWPGTLIKFLPAIYTGKPLNIRMINSAELRMNGTFEEEIIVTSLHDYKYDLQPPEVQDIKPMPGDWGIISGENTLAYNTIFNYGGKYINESDGRVVSDSSAVLHITKAQPGTTNIIESIFSNCYNHAIFVADSAITDGYVEIMANSFFLDQDSYGIKTSGNVLQTEGLVNGKDNYWNGKLGPYHPDLNSSGNGCRVDDYVDFSLYQTSTADSLSLLSSVIRGVVQNDQGELLKNAFVKLDSKEPQITYTDILGRFFLTGINPGDGYILEFKSKAHHGEIVRPLNISPDTSMHFTIELEKYTIDYAIDIVNFKVNPETSVVSVGGTAHRYYKIIDINTREPVYGAEVLVSQADTFYTNSKGIVDIAIPSARVGEANSIKSFYIQRIGIETLDFPEDQRETFEVRVKPYTYNKVWSGNTYFKVGISGVEASKLRGAALDLMVKDDGAGEYADSIRFARQTKNGIGYNLGASAKVSAGPVEAGAEAGIGINLNVLFEDDFKFDYPNATGRIALSKFIVLADGALPYMDAPLIRYFTVALEKQMSEIEAAALSNSIGMNLHGYASANAGIDLNLLEGDKGTLGAELKGSASVSGDLTYMAKVKAHKNAVTDKYPLDLSFDYATAIEAGVSAGVGFDLKKLFTGSENKEPGKDGTKVKKVDSNLPFPVPDEDFGFELASANASGGIRYGLQFGTTRFVPSPWCSLGFMYGYKYSYGAKAIFAGEKSNSQNREFRYTFDFYDDKMIEMVTQTADLAKSMMSPENLIDLKISDLTSGKIFNSPMNSVAYQQSRNSFSIPPVPYRKTVTDKVGEGGFNIVIDIGAAVVRGKFGAGFKYSENNKYPKEYGHFYQWNLYPLETYDFLEENEIYRAGPILQDIVSTSATYLVNEIKQKLIPPIFRQIRIWPFNKKAFTQTIPIGPGSRTSHLIFADTTSIPTIEGIDSLDVMYWDWYGTGDDSISSKKAAAKGNLALFEYVKSSSKDAHKIDYGIGGFYQFEPYNTPVGDHEVYVVINYFDDELTVMLSDSSITTLEENDLRMYKEDKENNRWTFIGGVVDTMNNTVMARIDSFGTFTLAPFIPSGELKLKAAPDTIHLEVADTTTITSDPVYYNTDEIVRDGELFTMSASRGSFRGTDADTTREGFQVAVMGGVIQLVYEANDLSGEVMILAESLMGDATGKIKVIVSDTTPPTAPVLAGIEMREANVHLWWEKNAEPDIVQYLVHYDTTSGGPYRGTASVFGEPSPVDAGPDSTLDVSGLTENYIYLFAISAVDRSGNESLYSNEMAITTEFNHKPVLYHKVIHIEPDLPNGTIIDTLLAVDEDEGQELTFYLSDSTTENAFAIDPATGIITVDNEVRLNYFVSRIDTFLIQVGVRDNASNPAADEGLVMVILNVDTWVPKYANDQYSMLELYPNPAHDQVFIKLGEQGFARETRVEIYRLDGKSAFSATYENHGQAVLKIPVDFLENGYYNVVVQTETGRRSGPLVI